MLSFIYTKFIYSRKPIGILDRIESNEEPSVLQSIWLILLFLKKKYITSQGSKKYDEVLFWKVYVAET